MAHARFVFPALALALGLSACDSGNKPSAKEPPASGAAPDAPAAKAPATAKAAPAADAGEKVKLVDAAGSDDRYALEVVVPSDAKTGEPGTAVVKVVPKAPWHINLDFPTSLKISAPEAVVVANADLKKGDLARLDDNGCEFNVDFKPSAAGEHTLTGTFKFAVCKDEACSPVSEDVEFKVAVK